MTTKVVNTKTQPAVIMDSLHCDSLTFKQVRENTPKRIMGISGCLYGVDSNGDKVYDKETFSMSDEDVDTTVVTQWVVDGGTPESFMIAYAAAKADIDARITAGTLKDPELMAMYEAVVARLLQLHGKIDISGIE